MDNKHRILIAEDHAILREGLRSLLSSNSDFEVVGEAEDGFDAIQRVEKLRPDLVLMDLSMPKMNGIEAIQEIKKRNPETKILILTVHKSDDYILASFRAGANGYVLKDATHGDLLMAIRNVLAGKHFLSPGISEKVIEGYMEGKKTQSPISLWDTLTHREREVLKLVAEGYKNKQIASYLSISDKTVEKHRANIMKKLDLHNTSALTAFAMEKGLVTR